MICIRVVSVFVPQMRLLIEMFIKFLHEFD